MHKTTLAVLALLGVAAAGCDDSSDGSAGGIETVTAGDGLTGGGSGSIISLAVDFTKAARAAHTHGFADLTGVPNGTTAGASCSGGQKATGINVAAGTVTCAADIDTDTNTDTLAGLSCQNGQVVMRGASGFVCSDAGLWTVLEGGEYRIDAHIGIGAFPFAAIQVDDENAQLVLRDREGASPPAIFMDDADGVGGAMGNITWQRVGVAVAQIFLGGDDSAVFQTEGGALRFKTGAAAEAMRIDGATGFVGIGNPGPRFPLVVGEGDDAPHNDGNTWVNRSSRAHKEGIRSFGEQDYSMVRRWLAETEVVWFHYKNSPDPRARVGLIAEDVPEVLATPDRKGISTSDAIGFLTAATKDLAGENRRLEAENDALVGRLAALERRLSRLETRKR